MAAGPSFDDRDPRPARGRKSTRKLKPAGRSGGGGRKSRPLSMRILRIGVVVGVLGACAACVVLIGLFTYYGSDPKLPNLSRLDAYHPKQVTRILDLHGAAIGGAASEKRAWLSHA